MRSATCISLPLGAGRRTVSTAPKALFGMARRPIQQGATESLGVDQSKVSRITRGPFRSVGAAKRTPAGFKLGRLRSMNGAIRIARLAAHPEAMPLLAAAFKAEWPAWYGPGGPGNAEHDLADFANGTGLPLGVVAFRAGAVCGVAALKAQSIPSHAHLSPWAAAGWVDPSLRQQGIGAVLLAALEAEAAALGHPFIYCGTSTAASLLERSGWSLLETVLHDNQALGIYRKALACHRNFE